MTQQSDYRILNVPMIMDRRVLVQDESGNMIPDSTWHERVLQRFEALYQFHLDRALLTAQFLQAPPPTSSLVLRRGDLTEAGWALWQSGAVDRWLNSFDRSPNKPVSNYKILEVALGKITASAA